MRRGKAASESPGAVRALFFALTLVVWPLALSSAQATSLAKFTLRTGVLVHDKQQSGVDILTAKGALRLGTDNNGADPAAESVTLSIGPFSQTLPPGSFTQVVAGSKTTWTFTGPVGGFTKLVIEKAGDHWTFAATARGLTLTLPINPNPLMVSLQLGDDRGVTSQIFVGKETAQKLLFKFPVGKHHDLDGDSFTVKEGDCDDLDPTRYPGAEEICDGVDNNCNQQIDEGATRTPFFRDADNDGYGENASTIEACVPPAGYVTNNQDCNDANPAIHPGATELCNEIDDNCDGTVDEGFDVGAACRVGVGACGRNGAKVCTITGTGTTCNATPGPPSAEICNNVDDDCDGQVDEGLGTLTCGQGGCEQTVAACVNGQPVVCTPGTPKAEICGNGIDEDCNGSDLPCVTTLQIAITAPANLSSTNRSTLAVTGTVDAQATEVTCNGYAAGINANGFGGSVLLKEGSNIITCVAQDAAGDLGSASITVTLDSTPPRVTIDSPPDGATVVTSPIAVTGIVNDLVMGTVNGAEAGVQCNGVPAQVANRRFVAAEVPLNLGANTIICIGTDKVGNVDTGKISVTLDTTAPAQIRILSGNNQTAGIGSPLAEPLVVGLTDNGAAAVGKVVVFKVLQNDGELSANNQTGRLLAVTTDADGHAAVQFKLGSWAGAGNNQVEALATGFTGEARFSASAQAGEAHSIVVDSGDNQTGVVEQKLPKPFVAVVIDRGSNRLSGAPVTFTVKEGGGSFDGQVEAMVSTDTDGRAAAVLMLGPGEGFDNNVVAASFPNNPGVAASFTASGKTVGKPEDTRISGVVLDNSNHPLQSVTLHIEGTTLTTQSDGQGQFVLQPAPVGKVSLVADGSTVPPREGNPWPKLVYDLVTIAGRDNTIGMPIYLLPIDEPNGLLVDETTGGTITLPEAPGFALTILPGSATFSNGVKRGVISVTVVHADKVPMIPNFGQQPRFIVTIQPAGTHFNPPAPLTLPNADGLAPGQKTEMYSFDHDLGSFVSIGPATVSEDGMIVTSDPGVGVVKGGWHCGGNPSGIGTCEHECDDGDDCTTDQLFFGKCLHLTAQDGTPCRDQRLDLSQGFFKCQLLSAGGFNFNIKQSCWGQCESGKCKNANDLIGIKAIANGLGNVCDQVFGSTSCMPDALRQTMASNMRAHGLSIDCGSTKNDACADASPNGNSMTLSNRSDRGSSVCGPSGLAIRHELQHGAGGQKHNLKGDGSVDCAVDRVYSCDVACFGLSTYCGPVDPTPADPKNCGKP